MVQWSELALSLHYSLIVLVNQNLNQIRNIWILMSINIPLYPPPINAPPFTLDPKVGCFLRFKQYISWKWSDFYYIESYRKGTMPSLSPQWLQKPMGVYWGFMVLVYRLKSVGALKMKFVAPMPEQINTPTMHFSEVSKDPSWDLTKMHCYGANLFWHGCNES